MIPEGKIIDVHPDRRRAIMARIQPVEEGRYILARNDRGYLVGENVRYGPKFAVGSDCDFSHILGPAIGQHRVLKRPANPLAILVYDPLNEFGSVQQDLSARRYDANTKFSSVPAFFNALSGAHTPGPRKKLGCVVLESLELPMHGYPQRLVPTRVKQMLSQVEHKEELLGGAIVVDECVNEYGLIVLVNRLFNGDYAFLRDAPNVDQLPYGRDERVSRVITAMGDRDPKRFPAGADTIGV